MELYPFFNTLMISNISFKIRLVNLFLNLNKLTDTVQKQIGYIKMYTCVAFSKWSVTAQSQCSTAIGLDFLWVKSLLCNYFINIHFPAFYILAKARPMSLESSKVGLWKSSSVVAVVTATIPRIWISTATVLWGNNMKSSLLRALSHRLCHNFIAWALTLVTWVELNLRS